MNIVLLACDHRRELMSRFCVSYYEILSKHCLFSVSSVARFLSDSAKLSFSGQPNDNYGGYHQICSKVSYNEVDLVIFFISSNQNGDFLSERDNILRLCDVYNVPIATNIATAEILIHGLSRGDFEWRKVGVPVI
ncbi:MAG: methylglyoxal synthase [Candidatus Improbicoccus pseudotrichonymphae]|uniref:Methylglyoxal synthase n=1 Tax=Candidatus Improbicoccus pseudotrichonymphae TaxID=3033792 RepID=A0AA48I2U7_9FIRM|nr:MAG: methylglyoxal synthase [Candidatus Improbicoccus pseudotrichonymphae]